MLFPGSRFSCMPVKVFWGGGVVMRSRGSMVGGVWIAAFGGMTGLVGVGSGGEVLSGIFVVDGLHFVRQGAV